MKYHIVERDAFRVVGIKREIPCDTGDAGIPGIAEFWGEVHENGIAHQLSQLNNGQMKGLLGIIENFNKEKNTIDYWIAAEHRGDASEEFSIFEFPASKWVVFEVRGPIPAAMVDTWKQIYSKWFPSHGYEPAGIASFEAYIDSDIYSPNSYNEIWIAIK
jgi:AraC family transcriptional regulator